MKPVTIKPDVYWIGALHPDLRLFDIIMPTKNGTTYNSYLVKGEQVAIIDTVKDKFGPAFIERIAELTDFNRIAYIVVQHNEMDHSGSLAALLEKAPQAKVICSKPAARYVQNILNRPVQIRSVENGEVIDLGGKSLQFFPSPFIHWPDTMMTYLPEKRLLFTCDLFGAHFCDSHLFNDQITRDTWPDFEHYFRSIMRPFKKSVRNALKKVDELDFDIIAPSHGPILRSGLDKYLQAYQKWSEPLPQNDPRQLLIYYASAYGNTEKMAAEIARGATAAGVTVKVYDTMEISLLDHLDRIEAADAIAIGSPTINGDAVKPVWEFLAGLATLDLKGKIGASFGSMGWSGEAVSFIDQRLANLKLRVIQPGIQATLVPGPEELQKCHEFGAALAQAMLT
ncbi:MAG TPA: FprA family A-type flavoprotein [bacterium]|nr:FprA family A-type flavoprotein [bacterium]